MSFVFILLVTIGLVVGILGPITRALERRELDELRARGAFIESEVSGFLSQSEQLARQLPSRTRIRQELVSYLRAERSLESYTAFAEPKLADAMSASPWLVSVVRFDRHGTSMASVNIEPVDLPPLSFVADSVVMLPGAWRIFGQNVVFFVVPIVHDGFGLAGYDVVAISLTELAEIIARAATRAGGAHVALVSTGEGGSSIPVDSPRAPREMIRALRELMHDGWTAESAEQTLQHVETAEGDLLLHPYRLTPDWVLGVARERDVLFEEVRADTRLFVLSVLLLGAVAAGVAATVLRTLSHRVVSDTEELNRIIEDQTRDLELLLKEIHHRVNNDIGMMKSFLSLKVAETSAPEAVQVLEEAQGNLAVMGRAYKRLQHNGHYSEASLQALLSGVVSDIAAGHIGDASVVQDIEAVSVPRHIAIPVGIIANQLITNALKYGDREWPVSVQLRSEDESWIELSVESGGCGFPAEVLRGEYGFGLSMVDTLAREYGGKLYLYNEPTTTAVVRIRPEKADS